MIHENWYLALVDIYFRSYMIDSADIHRMIELSGFFLQSTRPMMNGFASRGRSRLLLICCEAFIKGSKTGFIFEIGSKQTLRKPFLGLKCSHLNCSSGNIDTR